MELDASRMYYAVMDFPNVTTGQMKKAAMEPATLDIPLSRMITCKLNQSILQKSAHCSTNTFALGSPGCSLLMSPCPRGEAVLYSDRIKKRDIDITPLSDFKTSQTKPKVQGNCEGNSGLSNLGP